MRVALVRQQAVGRSDGLFLRPHQQDTEHLSLVRALFGSPWTIASRISKLHAYKETVPQQKPRTRCLAGLWTTMRPNHIEALVEHLRGSFERELQIGGGPGLEDYLTRIDEHWRPHLLRQLLDVEFSSLDRPEIERKAELYARELPEYATVIAECFEASDMFNTIAAADVPSDVADGDSTVRGPATPPALPAPLRQMGNYRLLKTIGEGGMGSVYLAEQERPVRRRVALKIIKAGLDSKQVIARFEAERQALAIMDHPGIARILDAGTTELGQPYFAMELVDGMPLTVYCDHHKLSLEKRLQLFLKICDAVQHAHQKGIIHRDLKPSNILVAEYNGQPSPKVIDFGLAKVLEPSQKLTDRTMFTEMGQVLGTLRYMSPEQASLDTLDIDTRADIYALGVVLYELLTGSTPLANEVLRGQGTLKVLELVREQDSQRPSSRLSTIKKEALETVTAQRRTDAKRLTQILLGDLDWIVMKALDKDRDRRYESANGFARDIDRYLKNEPVEARPPSLAYRARKFVKKNRGLVSAMSAIVALSLLGIAGIAWFAVDANSSRLEAEESATVARTNEMRAVENRRQALDAIDGFFVTVSEEELLDSPGLQPLRLKLLDRASNYYENLLADEKSSDSLLLIADAKSRYAWMLNRLGQRQRAHELLVDVKRAVEDVELDEDSTATQASIVIGIYVNLARVSSYTGDVQSAIDILAEALDLVEQTSTFLSSPEIGMLNAHVLYELGRLETARGQLSDANKYFARVRSVVKPYLEDDLKGYATSLDADALEELAEISPRREAAEYLDQAVEQRRQLVEKFPSTLSNIYSLAVVLKGAGWHWSQDEPEKAIGLFEEAERHLASLNRDNPSVIAYRQTYAETLDLHAFTLHQLLMRETVVREQRRDGLQEALGLYENAESVILPDTPGVTRQEQVTQLSKGQQSLLAMISNGKALVQRDCENLEKALEGFREALTIQQLLVEAAPDRVSPHRDVAGTWYNMGRTLTFFHAYEEAARHFQRARELQQQIQTRFPEEFSIEIDLANTQTEINYVLLCSGDYPRIKSEYVSVAQRWLSLREKFRGPLQSQSALASFGDALFTALDGNLDPLEALLPSLSESSAQDGRLSLTVITMMGGVIDALASEKVSTESENAVVAQRRTTERLFEIGQNLTAQLLANEVFSRAELAHEPLLGRWLQSE